MAVQGPTKDLLAESGLGTASGWAPFQPGRWNFCSRGSSRIASVYQTWGHSPYPKKPSSAIHPQGTNEKSQINSGKQKRSYSVQKNELFNTEKRSYSVQKRGYSM